MNSKRKRLAQGARIVNKALYKLKKDGQKLINKAIQSIIILSGSSTDWMATALLNATLNKRCTITIIESAEINMIKIDKATIPAIKQFNTMIRLKEPTFMRATRATLKLSIKFIN